MRYPDYGSEYNLELLSCLPQELRTIPKPYFVSTLLPEVSIAICRPLFPPFDNYAIAHNGTVFQYRPLHTVSFGEHLTLHPAAYCIPKVVNFVPLVRLASKLGHQKTYIVARLLLERFFHVSLTERISIDYLDNDSTNTHILNMEAFFQSPKCGRIPHEELDGYLHIPLH